MSAIGETLRRERLKRNLGLEEISRELKISARFLGAIEDEQFEKLPGTVFAKSFVRQYARLLGLDEEELAEAVQRAVEPRQALSQPGESQQRAPVDVPPLPRMEVWQSSGETHFSSSRSSVLPALALVVVVMLVCSGVYAWWQRQRTLASARVDRPAPVQTAPAPAITTPPVLTSPANPQAEAVPPQTAEAQPPAGAERVAPQPEAPVATPEKPKAPPPAIPPPNPNATVRVQVTADDTVWVLARADDKFMFSGTLEANQSRTVEGNSKVLLRLGNAGGVTITLNGKPVGPVGPKGQVRTVQFTSGGFQIVAAPPKPSLPLDDIL
jgi:cytoskeleton protein RodZ